MHPYHFGSNVRMRATGSWWTRAGSFTPQSDPYSRERHAVTVLLIHGYNVRPWNSEESYVAFKENLFKAGAPVGLHIVTVDWPGDVQYVSAPANATFAAPALADFIEEINPPEFKRTLYIVCHSLGCRFVLEALNELRRRGGSKLPKQVILHLMAAAVPVELVRATGRLALAAASASRIKVYYSGSDWVLRYCFPIGQRLSSDQRGSSPIEAVGLHGNPREFWGDNAKEMHRYGHGSYWPSSEIAKGLCEEVSNEPSLRRVAIGSRKIEPRKI
jgi:esterase/lipase superfamily enzyme